MNARFLVFFLLSISLLVGCGGGGEGGGETPVQLTGVLLDAQVINIDYRTETLSGVTNELGEFNFLPGETVTFSIGNLDFPPIAAALVVTPLTLAGAESTIAPTFINILRFLQTLDQDGDPGNGITITEKAKENAVQVDFNLTTAEFEVDVDVLSVIGNGGQDVVATALVDETTARGHFNITMADTPIDEPDPQPIPFADITVDGDNADWVGLRPVGIDPIGDNIGNTSNDIRRLYAATTKDSQMALLLETAGPVSFPHTAEPPFTVASGDYASAAYPIGIHFHNQSDCSDDQGFIAVANFTGLSADNQRNYHRLESPFFPYNGQDGGPVTKTGTQVNFLETSFPLDLIGSDKGSYISFLSDTTVGDTGGNFQLNDNLAPEGCFLVPMPRVEITEPEDGAIILTGAPITFSAVGYSRLGELDSNLKFKWYDGERFLGYGFSKTVDDLAGPASGDNIGFVEHTITVVSETLSGDEIASDQFTVYVRNVMGPALKITSAEFWEATSSTNYTRQTPLNFNIESGGLTNVDFENVTMNVKSISYSGTDAPTSYLYIVWPGTSGGPYVGSFNNVYYFEGKYLDTTSTDAPNSIDWGGGIRNGLNAIADGVATVAPSQVTFSVSITVKGVESNAISITVPLP